MKYIVDNNEKLLSEMNTAVVMFQNYSEEKVSLMKMMQFWLMIAGFAIIAFFIFLYTKTFYTPD